MYSDAIDTSNTKTGAWSSAQLSIGREVCAVATIPSRGLFFCIGGAWMVELSFFAALKEPIHSNGSNTEGSDSTSNLQDTRLGLENTSKRFEYTVRFQHNS